MRIVEEHRAWYKFLLNTPEAKAKRWVALYPTATELKRCLKPILGNFEIIDKEQLPTVVTQEMIDECPESAFVQAGNLTYAYNFFERVVLNDIAIPYYQGGWRAYLVKDKEAFEKAKENLIISSINYFKTKVEVGEKIRWDNAAAPTEFTALTEGFTYGASKEAAENDEYCKIMARHDAERDVRIDSFLEFADYARDDGYHIGRADYEKYLKYYDEEKAKMSGNSGNICPHCEQPVRGDEDVCPHCGFDNYGEGLAAAFI